MARNRTLSDEETQALSSLRGLCQAFADCEETLSYGNPAFKRAGKRGSKAFAVLDRYKGHACLWVLIDPVLRDDQLAAPGWFASPYDPRQTALCCPLEKLDWSALGPVIEASYHLAQART